jgi:hypothetical protein
MSSMSDSSYILNMSMNKNMVMAPAGSHIRLVERHSRKVHV